MLITNRRTEEQMNRGTEEPGNQDAKNERINTNENQEAKKISNYKLQGLPDVRGALVI